MNENLQVNDRLEIIEGASPLRIVGCYAKFLEHDPKRYGVVHVTLPNYPSLKSHAGKTIALSKEYVMRAPSRSAL